MYTTAKPQMVIDIRQRNHSFCVGFIGLSGWRPLVRCDTKQEAVVWKQRLQTYEQE